MTTTTRCCRKHCRDYWSEDRNRSANVLSYNFRQQLNESKERLKSKDFTVSNYDLDSSKHWKVISKISRIKKNGVRSLSITSEFKQKGKSVKELVNDIDNAAFYTGQTITSDRPGKVVLCYLLKTEKDSSIIFRVPCSNTGQHQIELLDSLTTKEWAAIKSAIYNEK